MLELCGEPGDTWSRVDSIGWGMMGTAFGHWLLASTLVAALWFSPGSAYGQSRELLEAHKRSGVLYGQGRYQEALQLAEKAVRLGEEEFGANPQDASVRYWVSRYYALSLNNLAGIYVYQRRYAEAEPLYKRALAIAENGPYVGTILNDLARLYYALGRISEAEPLCKRALATHALAIKDKECANEQDDARARGTDAAFCYDPTYGSWYTIPKSCIAGDEELTDAQYKAGIQYMAELRRLRRGAQRSPAMKPGPDASRRVPARPLGGAAVQDSATYDQVRAVQISLAALAACRTEVRENGCGRIAMWRGHGIERFS